MIKKLNPIMIIIPVVVIAIIGKKLDFSGSNNTEVSLTDYYKLPEGEARLVVDLIKSDENAIIKDGKTYLPYSAAEKMMPRIFYDALDDVVVYTTATEKYVYTAGDKEYQVNGKDETEEVPSFIDEGRCL